MSAQLGHANPSTTLRHYAKWIPSQGRRWVEVLDRANWSAGLEIGTKIWNQTGPNLKIVAQAIENFGEPSGTRTRDPLIKTIAPAVDARGPKAGITFYTVERPVDTLGPLTGSSISVSCEEGDQVLSGGYLHGGFPDLQVSGSAPTGEGAWLVQVQNFSETLSRQIALFARCARLTP